MDLRTLQHAIALAHEGNFARAAARQHISQPAMSRSIQALEQELGLALFDRTSQGTIPTAVGRRFLQKAQLLLSNARTLRHEMDLLRGGERGELSFGVGPAASILLPTLLAEISQEHPKLCFRIDVDNWEGLRNSLRQESIEFFVASRQLLSESEEFEFIPVGEFGHGHFFCRTSHPLTERETPSLAELKEFPLISTRMPDCVQMALRQAFRVHAGEPGPFAVICDNMFLLQRMLLTSDAVLYAASQMVAEDLASGALVKLPLVNPYSKGETRWQLDIVILADRTLSPLAVMLIKRMQALYAQLSEHW